MLGNIMNVGNIVNKVASSILPGPIGKALGGVLGGIGNIGTGNIFGAVNSALQAFKGLAGGGVGGLGGGSRLAAPMGGMPFGKTGGALSNAATGGPGGFTAQMKGIMNNKNMSPEQKKMAMLDLQEKKDMFDQMIQTLTAMQKRSHDTNMAVIRNLG